MDEKFPKMMTSERKKMTAKQVQFCADCVKGYRCKVCDDTFMKLHTTSFHQYNVDITAFLADDVTEMIVDIGCPNSVIGAKDVNKFIKNLSRHQQQNLEMREVDENFKFGPSGPYRCHMKIRFPVVTPSKHIIAEVAIVQADIPMLLGNNILKPLEAELKLFSTGNGVLKLKDAETKMRETSGGHYTVKVADLSNLSDATIYFSNRVNCNICEYSFKTNDDLRKHNVKQHRGKSSVTCEVCEKYFKSNEELKKHNDNLHGSSWTVVCEECHKYFATEEDFKKHKVIQHERNQTMARFSCKGCDFIAKNEIALEMHILDCHWTQEYRCEKCEFITCSVDEYNVHIEKVHSRPLKSILKNKILKTDDASDDLIMHDLNTLLNGSKSRRESKLISTVRNLVKMNQKQNNERLKNEIKTEDLEEQDHFESIFLSHHEEYADADEVKIEENILDVFFCEDNDKSALTETEKKEVLKLHKYFAHRNGKKLWENLFQPAGKLKGKKKLIMEFLNKCEVCSKFRRTPGRPKVGMAKSKDVNEIVSMDLKILKKSGKTEVAILYLHDSGQVLNDKKKETIIQAIENKWIVGGGIGPGHPTKGFFSDNGGEFLNEDLIDFASSLNISIKMTSASSPWSNGSCERAHATVEKIVEKILEDDPKIGIQKAVDWTCFVKKTLRLTAQDFLRFSYTLVNLQPSLVCLIALRLMFIWMETMNI